MSRCPLSDDAFNNGIGMVGLYTLCSSFEIKCKQLESERDALQARVKRLEEALVSIQEYWNRDNNEGAMQDACWHAINTAIDALEAKEYKP